MSRTEGDLVLAGVVTVPLGAIIGRGLRMPRGFRRGAERQTRRRHAEGENEGVLGPKVLEPTVNEPASRLAHAEPS